MKAELGEVGREARLGTGDAEIGGERQPQSAADRRAMDRGHDRLLVAEDAHRLDIEMVDRQVRGRIGLGALLLLLPLRIAEIGAGAKRLALGGENRASDFDVGIERLQRVGDLVDQLDVEEIKRWFTDLDQADMAVLLDADICVVGHALLRWTKSIATAATAPAT